MSQSKKASKKLKNTNSIALKALAAREKAEQEEKVKAEEQERLRQLHMEEEKRLQEEEILHKIRADEVKRLKKEEKERLKKCGLLKTKAQQDKEEKDKRAVDLMISSGMMKPEPASLPRGLPCKKKKSKPNPAPSDQPPAADSTLASAPNPSTNTPNLQPEDPAPELPPASIQSTSSRNRESSIEQVQIPTLRSPIICVLGHVDTGKTTLLDKIRHSNVQNGEAGGITQQIGVTMFTQEVLQSLISKVENSKGQVQIPGLLIIDTPGHTTFSSLRSRGSSLCDLAVLVVDLMHGLEETTISSIKLLQENKLPYIVALNKVDRLYKWKASNEDSILKSLNSQESFVSDEFDKRVKETVLQFAVNGINAALYYQNNDPEDYISMVPISARTGEGIPDLIACIVDSFQNQFYDKILFRNELKATVMEVKVVEGLGTTVDVILENGKLEEGDKIVIAGFGGNINTSIRTLLTPMPLKEMRVRGEYVHHKCIFASIGVKIAAQGLEDAMPGSPIFLVNTEEHATFICETRNKRHQKPEIFSYINPSGAGVHIQSSTIGSLEALLESFKAHSIPVSSYGIGPVCKKEIMKAQRQLDQLNKRQYSTIIAFDVKILPDAQQYSEKVSVKIFQGEIVDKFAETFLKYESTIKHEERLAEGKGKGAVLPCLIRFKKIIKTNPIISAEIEVMRGVLACGTPLCLVDKDKIDIGVVKSIEVARKSLNEVRSCGNNGRSVMVKVKGIMEESVRKVVEEGDVAASRLSDLSVGLLEEYFMEELEKDDWELVNILKKSFGVTGN